MEVYAIKTVIITGANSGLGFETAKKIAQNKNFQVILACRNKEKAEKTKEEIIKETNNNNIITMIIDTSSLSSVRNFVNEFKKLNTKVYGLICNAGISSMHSGTTEDGFELVFATNYLGHFLLANMLLPYMEKDGKILNITSDMHNPPGGIKWKDPELLVHPTEEDRSKYSYSKLGNIYFTYELDKRLRKINSNIVVNAFNPGLMTDTNFAPKINKVEAEARKLMFKDRVGDLKKSSSALSELIVNDGFNGISGKYFDRSTNYTNSSELSYNKENSLNLWNKSIEYCNLKSHETLEGII